MLKKKKKSMHSCKTDICAKLYFTNTEGVVKTIMMSCIL